MHSFLHTFCTDVGIAFWSIFAPNPLQNLIKKNSPKNTRFLHRFFNDFRCIWDPIFEPDAQDIAIWSKESPQDLPRHPLDLDFNTILDDFLGFFEGIFVMLCFPLFSFALLCFALLYWINNQSPALSKQCLNTPTASSKQCFFTGTVAGDAKHLGYIL